MLWFYTRRMGLYARTLVVRNNTKFVKKLPTLLGFDLCVLGSANSFARKRPENGNKKTLQKTTNIPRVSHAHKLLL